MGYPMWNDPFYFEWCLVIDVHVTVILDTRTFREEQQQQSRVISLTKF